MNLSNEILNSVEDYFVVHCSKTGYIKNSNAEARKHILIDETKNNILDFIREEYKSIIRQILINPSEFFSRPITWVVGFKSNVNCYISTNIINETDIVFSFKDITKDTKNDAFWTNKLLTYKMQVNRYNKVLECISTLYKNILYRNRSDLEDILLHLTSGLKLDRSVICFRNGVNHVIACVKQDEGYKCQKLDGPNANFSLPDVCTYDEIWGHSKLLKVSASDCGYSLNDDPEREHRTVDIIQLVLDNKIIGYFGCIPEIEYPLSTSEMEALENLSQILSYVINNKEETRMTIDYINTRLRNI